MFSFFFAFLLYSKILYYSIRNKSRNLVQIFVDFNQLECKIAHFSIFRQKIEPSFKVFSEFWFYFFENSTFYCATVPSVACAAGSAVISVPPAGAVWSAAGCCAAAAAPLFKAASAASSSTSV